MRSHLNPKYNSRYLKDPKLASANLIAFIVAACGGSGGGGRDTLSGGEGADTLSGGRGRDTLLLIL